MRFTLLLYFCLLCGWLHAQECVDQDSSLTVCSGEAEYDGEEVILKGDVMIQHALGKISAKELSISSSQEKGQLFSFLKLNDQVHIVFQAGGELSCQKGEIDYSLLKGTFTGNESDPEILFTYSNTQIAPLAIKAVKGEIDFIQHEKIPKKAFLNRVTMQDQVQITFDDCAVEGDLAVYQLSQNPLSTGVDGVLTLDRGARPFCLFSRTNGDRVESEKIIVDRPNHQVVLSQSSGSFSTVQKDSKIEQIRFQCDKLVWNELEQQFSLEGAVKVYLDQLIQITTPHQLKIDYKLIDGKNRIQLLTIPNDSELLYFHPNQQEIAHKISCPGPLHVNHEKGEIVMMGASGADGRVVEGKQVYLEDLLGEMCADHLKILYSMESHGIGQPKIYLTGHIQIYNRFSGHQEESGSVLQYALADQLDYDPALNEVDLKGVDGGRVLFFDKMNGVQMSAPLLKIHYDQKTKKEKVQGFGDVRFTFMESELKQFKDKFRLSGKAQLKDRS